MVNALSVNNTFFTYSKVLACLAIQVPSGLELLSWLGMRLASWAIKVEQEAVQNRFHNFPLPVGQTVLSNQFKRLLNILMNAVISTLASQHEFGKNKRPKVCLLESHVLDLSRYSRSLLADFVFTDCVLIHTCLVHWYCGFLVILPGLRTYVGLIVHSSVASLSI